MSMRNNKRGQRGRHLLAAMTVGAVATCALGSVARAAPPSIEAPATVQPLRRALVVGNNQGDKPERSLRYAEEEVSRLATLLKKRGAFSQVDVLQGANAAAVSKQLKAIHDDLEAAKAKGQPTLFSSITRGTVTMKLSNWAERDCLSENCAPMSNPCPLTSVSRSWMPVSRAP